MPSGIGPNFFFHRARYVCRLFIMSHGPATVSSSNDSWSSSVRRRLVIGLARPAFSNPRRLDPRLHTLNIRLEVVLPTPTFQAPGVHSLALQPTQLSIQLCDPIQRIVMLTHRASPPGGSINAARFAGNPATRQSRLSKHRHPPGHAAPWSNPRSHSEAA